MPSTITITCRGNCGRRLVMDAVAFDAWHVSDTCRECQDRQMAEYHQQLWETDKAQAPVTEHAHADHR